MNKKAIVRVYLPECCLSLCCEPGISISWLQRRLERESKEKDFEYDFQLRPLNEGIQRITELKHRNHTLSRLTKNTVVAAVNDNLIEHPKSEDILFCLPMDRELLFKSIISKVIEQLEEQK